jgi:hypothetical protein
MLTTTIDGYTVYTNELPFTRAMPLLRRLALALGPAMGQLPALSGEADVSALGSLLGSAFASLSEDDMVSLPQAILQGTTIVISGEKIELSSPQAFNKAFTSRILLAFKVMAWVVQSNFADFFGEVRGQAV